MHGFSFTCLIKALLLQEDEKAGMFFSYNTRVKKTTFSYFTW